MTRLQLDWHKLADDMYIADVKWWLSFWLCEREEGWVWAYVDRDVSADPNAYSVDYHDEYFPTWEECAAEVEQRYANDVRRYVEAVERSKRWDEQHG